MAEWSSPAEKPLSLTEIAGSSVRTRWVCRNSAGRNGKTCWSWCWL